LEIDRFDEIEVPNRCFQRLQARVVSFIKSQHFLDNLRSNRRWYLAASLGALDEDGR
jgi:hypothetical protein